MYQFMFIIVFGPKQEIIISNNKGLGMNNGVTINAVIPNPQIVIPVPQVTVQAQFTQQNPYSNNSPNPYSNTQVQNNQQNDVQVVLNQKMLILKNQKQW